MTEYNLMIVNKSKFYLNNKLKNKKILILIFSMKNIESFRTIWYTLIDWYLLILNSCH